MRGQRSIYFALFPEYQNVLAPKTPERKGRSESLIQKRNELIICRYLYYIKIIGKKYPDALTALENEMFLTPRTIIDLLNRQHLLLKKLAEQKPTLKELRQRYPMMVWETSQKAS